MPEKDIYNIKDIFYENKLITFQRSFHYFFNNRNLFIFLFSSTVKTKLSSESSISIFTFNLSSALIS